jgi:hypothetical protein
LGDFGGVRVNGCLIFAHGEPGKIIQKKVLNPNTYSSLINNYN